LSSAEGVLQLPLSIRLQLQFNEYHLCRAVRQYFQPTHIMKLRSTSRSDAAGNSLDAIFEISRGLTVQREAHARETAPIDGRSCVLATRCGTRNRNR
jgi:hypothetical protein